MQELGSGREGFNLSVSLRNKVSFIILNSAIRLIFDLINPFNANGFMTSK